MTINDFRSSIAWQTAIGLGPRLVLLAEDLPAHEQTGLVMQLSSLMVQLPGAIAADLIDGTSLRFMPYYQLSASLDVIDRVYPALDMSAARHALDELGQRIGGANFSELVFSPDAVPAPAPAPVQPAPQQLPPTPQVAPPGPINLSAATAAQDAQGLAAAIVPPVPTLQQAPAVHVQPNIGQ